MTHYCRLHSVGCHRIVYYMNIDVFLYHSQYVKRKHNKSSDIFSGSFTHVVTTLLATNCLLKFSIKMNIVYTYNFEKNL